MVRLGLVVVVFRWCIITWFFIIFESDYSHIRKCE